MNHYYGTQVPQNFVDDILKKTDELIQVRQLCKDELPEKCNLQINSLISQNFQTVFRQNQQRPDIQGQNQIISPIKNDNQTPFLLKYHKRRNVEVLSGRMSFDAQSMRKTSALKSRREQYTASTSNPHQQGIFNKTFERSLLDQRPWTQTECRKLFSRTSESSGKAKYIRLNNLVVHDRSEDEDKDKDKRIDLREKRRNEKNQEEKTQQALMKISRQKYLLRQQLENARFTEKSSYARRNMQTVDIVNFQVDNGALLTNKFQKPFRRTIENLISLDYEESSQDRILKRKVRREYQVENIKKRKNQRQDEIEIDKLITINSNFNNAGRRQVSFIPYLTINPGVSLSESTIQATISRARPRNEMNREKFSSSIENKTFRHHSRRCSVQKDIQMQMQTIDVCQKNRASKTTLNNETKDSFRKSILWGTKTSRDGHRIKLQKEDFLKQFSD